MLFTRFGGNGLPVDLFNSLPPLGNLAKSCVSRASMPHQPAPNHGASSANSAPTVEVHGLAVTNSGVDGIEDPGHLPRTAGKRRRWHRGSWSSAPHWSITGCRSYPTAVSRQRASSFAISTYGTNSPGSVRSMKWSIPALSKVLSFLAASAGSFAPGNSPAAKRPGAIQ